MAFSWIGTSVYMFSLTCATSAVIDGVCYAAVIWSSQLAKALHYIWSVISFYVIIILIVVFCYWRILAAIRRQANVMAGHGSSAAQIQSDRLQTSVIKTMILVNAFFAVTHFPVIFFFLIEYRQCGRPTLATDGLHLSA